MKFTLGEEYDSHHFTSPINSNLRLFLAHETHITDKAYNDVENQYNLDVIGLHPAIRLQ